MKKTSKASKVMTKQQRQTKNKVELTHVYLDDLRTPPEGWTLVKNYAECIAALETGEVEYLSLDHDLADEHYCETGDLDAYDTFVEKTGYDVCKWMAENNVWPKVSITLHTANPIGRENMRAVLLRYKPEHVKVYG